MPLLQGHEKIKTSYPRFFKAYAKLSTMIQRRIEKAVGHIVFLEAAETDLDQVHPAQSGHFLEQNPVEGHMVDGHSFG